jgi:rod shape-determining protein MreC
MALKGGRMLRLAVPLKALVQRFAFALLLATAASLMVVGKADVVLVERIRTAVVDEMAPVLVVLSRPAAAINRLVDEGQEIVFVFNENRRLREENARLRQWQDVARRLEPENARLRRLLSAGVEPPNTFITARVVGDAGGPFVRTMLLSAGERDGIEKGQAVVADGSFVGRITEVGQRSARILLLTDLNSRVPVALESSRHRAVLAGDNSRLPRLEYLPAGAEVAVGDRIVTSGDGGLFPPGIAVGQVVSVSDSGVRVQPLVELDQLEYVRAISFESPRLPVAEFGRSGGRR